MNTAVLIFPHQLFKSIDQYPPGAAIYLVEEYLFFRQYKFHKQKLIFQRASMKAYQAYLLNKGFNCLYIETSSKLSDISHLLKEIDQQKIGKIIFTDPCDNWLHKRITEACQIHKIEFTILSSPLFINTIPELDEYFKNKKKLFQTDFYIEQRKKRSILVDAKGKPMQDKWSFDADNRLKYPTDKTVPALKLPVQNSFYKEAIKYVDINFKNNPGNIVPAIKYPSTFAEAENWLDDFLETRLAEFGYYEDAIVKEELLLHHSLLSPLLNTGLLLPMQVINKAILCAKKNEIPINSLEGFVRQIIGWREFIRAVYLKVGNRQRTTNYWDFKRKIPASFYNGTTGIGPVDDCIKKLLKTGYNHHIERLMILSNFMLLCEFHPDEVYRWFMEMYIDAYDWVMVPNVYGMGQFADGGLMCTKPYISGSNYVVKMSNYKKTEDWCGTWDALFWRFMHTHRDFFLKNPRLGMLVKTFDKMVPEKQNNLLQVADDYLKTLDK